jgi:arginine utilization protein RocB
MSLLVVGITVVGDSSQLPNKSEIKHIISTAHTSDDFRRLAEYFDQRSAEFERKAQQQEKELARLLALPFHARSYPTQVATTRDLISRYKTQASTNAEQAKEYRACAENTRRGK